MPAVAEPPIAFTPKEEALLRLLLCPNASSGEVENAGRALVASWRRRGLLAETLLEAKAEPRFVIDHPPRASFDPGDMILPFGKCRGLPLRRVKRSYLQWVLRNVEDLQPELERAIRAVLYGN
jgi:hypothetical protein